MPVHSPITCSCKYSYRLIGNDVQLVAYINKCEEHAHLNDQDAMAAALKKNREYVPEVEE